jgi:predicted transcriptional regulator YdeE
MEKQKHDAFALIGITVRTCNTDGTAAVDIPALWQRFRSENLLSKIHNVLSPDVYSVYTEYEGDYTRPYTTLIGYRVADLDDVPEGLTGILIPQGEYQKRVVTGNLLKGAVYEAWLEIWQSDIPRAYTADYEVYGAGEQDPENALVDIYLSVK